MSSISTKRGDDGTTSLLYGQRVPKHHPQIEAVGALDELNVALGAVRSCRIDTSGADRLGSIQRSLIALMGEVSCAQSDLERFEKSNFAKLTAVDVARLDAEVTAIESRLPPPTGWVMPGSNECSVCYEQARVAARRAERRVVGLADVGRRVRPEILQYLNRLSDLLWLLARESEK